MNENRDVARRYGSASGRMRAGAVLRSTAGFSLTLALLAAAILSPTRAEAQSGFFLRFAPEVSRVTVEHTKVVTIGGGSSSSTSAHSGVGMAGVLSGGVRSGAPAGWTFGGEVEVVITGRRLIEGIIHPTTSGEEHDVWSGRWEFQDRFGVGGIVVVGRGLGEGRPRLDFVLGARRMWSEFATGGTNPETGVFGEDRTRLGRWPALFGVGLALGGPRPIDLRLRYATSSTDWINSGTGFRLDYGYDASALILSAGIATH